MRMQSRPSIKFHHNMHIFFLECFHRGDAELLAFFSRFAITGEFGNCVSAQPFAQSIAVTRVHIGENVIIVFFDIIHHAILNDPLETIELRDCGFQVERVILVVENGNALMSAENVEALLAETLELEFILVMDLEPDEFARGSGEFVDGIIELGIVCDEPVDDSERDARFSVDDRHHRL